MTPQKMGVLLILAWLLQLPMSALGQELPFDAAGIDDCFTPDSGHCPGQADTSKSCQ